MGAWSGEPFGNDTAADWAWKLDKARDWREVEAALSEAIDNDEPIDDDVATNAIAAAEVVAHGLGRATQTDAYTESVAAFVRRAPAPGAELVSLASEALNVATGPGSGLTELWEDEDPAAWRDANAKLATALQSGPGATSTRDSLLSRLLRRKRPEQ